MSVCEFKDYLEIVYFLSGPVVAIGVVIALKQYLKVSKDIDDKYSREINKQIIDDVTAFNKNIVFMFSVYKSEIPADTMSFTYAGDVTDLKNNNLIESAESYYNNTSEKAREAAKDLIIELNRLCLSSQLGIADERTTYDIIGDKFLEIFENVSFMAVIISKKDGANLQYLFNTYREWKNWRELDRAKIALLEKQAEVADLQVNAKEPKRPIGL